MIDRIARDRLAQTIESFLDERIKARAFEKRIAEIAEGTNDEAVKHVAHSLWFYYDDFDNHTAVLAKEEWDHIQRLLLLLRSDAELQVEWDRTFEWSHAAAAATLGVFLMAALPLGFGAHLCLVAIPFGLISLLISRFRFLAATNDFRKTAPALPFGSFTEILAIRRNVADFRKRRYPEQLRTRRIRSPIMDWIYALQAYSMWLLFSPVVLLAQSVPERIERTTILTPIAAPDGQKALD